MATNPMFQPPTSIDWKTATEFYDVSTPQEIRRPKRRAGAEEPETYTAAGPMEDSTTVQSERWSDVVTRCLVRSNMREAMRIRVAEGKAHAKDLQRKEGPMFKMVPGS